MKQGILIKGLLSGSLFVVFILIMFYVFIHKAEQESQESLGMVALGVNGNQLDSKNLPQIVLDDAASIAISLLATSTQDRNAVVQVDNKVMVVSEGDPLSSDTSSKAAQLRVAQIGKTQLVLKDKRNVIYLLGLSGADGVSSLQKISNDISVNQPLPVSVSTQ